MWATLISTAGQAMSGISNNYYAGKRAEQDRLQNFMYGEKAANAADERFRKQYLDLFSPKAQMKQLKEAGLSPALAYGHMSGAGGATAPQGGGGNGMQTPYYPTTALDMAQLQNIMAQTEKTNAEKDNVEQDTKNKGQQFNLIGEQIQNVAKDTEHKDVGIKAMQISNEINSITLLLEKFKYEEGISIEQIESEARTLYNNSLLSEEQYKLVQNNRKLAEETFENNVNIIAAQYSNLVQDLLVKEAQIKLTNEQCKKVINDILVDWYNAKVYNLSEKAKIIYMKDQLKFEYTKLGLTGQIANMENTTKVLTSIMQSLSSLAGMSMVANGGIKLQPNTPQAAPTTPQIPSLPYN